MCKNLLDSHEFMAQTKLGAAKTAARYYGLSLEEYLAKLETEKACKLCKQWKSRESFCLDKGSSDGFGKACFSCRRAIHSEATKEIISKKMRLSARRGPNNHNWKGGVSPEEKIIRRSYEYCDWRKAVFNRDHFTCQLCGDNRGGNLQAHHLKGFADYPELRFDIANGQTLCKTCHTEIHKRKER